MRKVPFSHPFAHLDPKFSVKIQRGGSSHQAEGGGSGPAMDDSDTAPNPHKHPHEVLLSPTPSHPRAGIFKQPLNSSDLDYQESTQSSDDSSGGLGPILIKEG
jgi:hypothetical protein